MTPEDKIKLAYKIRDHAEIISSLIQEAKSVGITVTVKTNYIKDETHFEIVTVIGATSIICELNETIKY